MERSFDLYLMLWNVLAFGLMLLIIKYAVWPKLLSFIKERNKTISEAISNYEKRNQEINELVETIKNESQKASERRHQMLNTTLKESEKIREEILKRAHNEAVALVEKAKLEITKERESAFLEVKKDVSKIINIAIRKILKNVITKEIDQKIQDQTESLIETIE